MRLRCLAGAYAGQIRDYSTPVGLAALRSGTAAPLEAAVPAPKKVVAVVTPPATVGADKRRKGR